MNEIEQLYQKIILTHANYPVGFNELVDYDFKCHLKNPDCGDDLTVYGKWDGDGQRLAEISFTGDSCIISKASASMMVSLLQGKTATEIANVWTAFQKLVLNQPTATENLGDLVAFATLHNFPTRVRCGTLAWHALQTGIQEGRYEND